MRALLIAVTLAGLTACSAAPERPATPLAAKASSGPIIVATLASVGSADELTAAPLTKVELLNKRIARDVANGKITPDTARRAAANADQARTKLARAIDEIDRGNKQYGLSLISEANALSAEGEAIREGAK